jgi:hypothetical protein
MIGAGGKGFQVWVATTPVDIGALQERRCPQRPSLRDRCAAWQLDDRDRRDAGPLIR